MCHICEAGGGPCLHAGAAGTAGTGPLAAGGPSSGGAPTGLKWGARAMGTPGGAVTWSLAGAGIDISAFANNALSFDFDAFFGFDVAALAREAFAIWSEVADVEFIEVADDGVASAAQSDVDIRIFLGNAVERYNLGAAFFPGTTGQAGDILVVRTGQLSIRAEDGAYDHFLHLLLHEIGHAIGLAHSPRTAAVMNARVVPGDTKTALIGDDIGAAVATYGMQDGAPVVHEMAATRDDLDLLHAPEPLRVVGNDRDNRIAGSAGPETLEGGAGQDFLSGRAGDDVLTGGAGSDTLFGGAGRDLAHEARAHAATVVSVADGTVTIGAAAEPGGRDVLADIEHVAFADGILAVDVTGSGLGPVARLYQAAFGRGADEGVLFWQQARRDGLSDLALARSFVDSLEFEARYGADPDDGAYVDALYLNVVGRVPDDGGRAFWIDALGQGAERAELLIAFSESPENRALTDDAISSGLFFAGASLELLG